MMEDYTKYRAALPQPDSVRVEGGLLDALAGELGTETVAR